jgi:hypothetical protein
MARQATAAARARAARPATAPSRVRHSQPARLAPPRRRSGPTGGRAALRPQVPVRAILAHGLSLDRVLRGRGWIALVGILLVGIVFFNVSLLRLNTGIARTSERTNALKRENSRLQARLAGLRSSERIQRVAAARGFVLPAPGEVRYLRVHRGLDARRAAHRITEPQLRPAPPPTLSRAPAAVPRQTAPAHDGAPAAPAPDGAAPAAGQPAPAAAAPGGAGAGSPAGGAPAVQGAG